MLTLRGHHLLCVLNYSGSGYTEEFIQTFDEACARMTAGEEVLLTWKPDTLCQPMLDHPESHCREPRIHLRDFFGFLNASILLRTWLWPGRRVVLTKEKVERLRRGFHSRWVRTGCTGCEWFDHCTKNAKDGYLKSKLHLRK